MIDDRTQEGRLARWFRELEEPPDLRPLKRIDLRLTGFTLMALVGAVTFFFAHMIGILEMVEGLPSVLQDGSARHRFAMWGSASVGYLGLAGATACYLYKIHRWLKRRREAQRGAEGPGEQG